jgi:FkbM family methyltransferase
MREIGPLLAAGAALSKYLPRGKGAVARMLGTLFLRPRSRYLVTRHGAKLVLSPTSLDVYSTMRARNNAWDYHDFQVCYAGSPDGAVFYDVGSNVGYFSIEMAALTGQAVKTVAFEPQDSLVEAIEASIRLNHFEDVLTVVNALVGDTSGEAQMFVAPASIHSSAVADSNRPIKAIRPKRMVTIDELVEGGSIPPPDMVKMDIEGSEHLALRGAGNVLRRHKPHVFLEYHERDDPGLRVWNQVEALMHDTGCYDLYCSPHSNLRHLYPSRFFPFRTKDDLALTDNLFLRNRDRDVRDETMFGSTP